MAASNSGRQRVASMSSMRNSKWPWAARAMSKFNNAESACPRCKKPFGLGAKRKTGADIVIGARINDWPRALERVHRGNRQQQRFRDGTLLTDLPVLL